MHDDNKITYFAETDARNRRVAFGIKAKDRLKHIYVIGKTGMGKSTLLENMAVQDIQNGEGMCFLDPHGKSADLLLEYIPKERIKDVVWFAPFDADYPVSFNVMEDVGPDKRHLVTSGLMSAFKKLWVDQWSARMEYILTNTILALLEYPDSTLLGINKMYSDKEYRKKVVDNITDPAVKSFWVDEYAKYTDRFAAEATPAIQNKIGQFLSNPVVRNVIGQPKSSFDIRKLMDERKILIVNLSKGLVGEVNANLLGSMLITKLYLGAMSRADTPEPELRKLPNFYLYVDEFQSFANESFANILSEARKYKLNLTIAHQYIEQMSEEVRAAVLGNVGTMIVFRVGAYDAEVLEKEFAPTFMAADLVNLGQRQIYLKLMIDDVSSAPFSATTLPPIKKPASSHVPEIIASSRKMFAQPKAHVEELVRAVHGLPSQALAVGGVAATGTAASAEKDAHKENKENKERRMGERRQMPREGGNDRREPARPHPASKSDKGNGDGGDGGSRPEEPKKNPFSGIKLEGGVGGGYRLVEAENSASASKESLPDQSRAPKPAKKPENKKEPTPENRQTLRDALSSVLKKPAARQEEAKQDESESAPSETRAEPRPAEMAGDTAQKQTFAKTASENRARAGEIPEEELRKVLNVDGAS